MKKSRITLYEYLQLNPHPEKVICIDERTDYHSIPLSLVYLPICSGMVVDHVEIDPNELGKQVVFVRVPEVVKGRCA